MHLRFGVLIAPHAPRDRQRPCRHHPIRCIVSLHGKGGDGAPATTIDGIERIAPSGNGEAWGGRQWEYDDETDYSQAVASVSDAIVSGGCDAAAIHGFSNGATFAAKLFCSGETFDSRVVGFVIDDPAADAATSECAPPPSVQATLYWTGALEAQAPAGTDCTTLDWTCEGDVIVGIDSFAAGLGIDVTPSPFSEHRRFDDAPDPVVWLDSAQR